MTRTVVDPSKSIDEGQEHYFFEILDDKGRELGARLSFSTHTFVEHPSGHYITEPGEYLTFCPQATRGGKSFGACQTLRLFKTEAELIAGVEKYLADAKKRAVKQWGEA